VLLLDTNAVVWLGGGIPLRGGLDEIEAARRAGELIVSTVSAWEIATLVRKGRLQLNRDPVEWFRAFGRQPGVRIVPLSADAAAGSNAIPDLTHNDPADRLLIATARELGAAIATRDARILGYASRTRYISAIRC